MSKRTILNTLRKELNQQNADSTYLDQFLYDSLMKQAPWLIKREVSAGRIYRNNSIFQTLPHVPVIQTSVIPDCLHIPSNCKIYRTKHPLPEMWMDNDGHIIKSVSSLDGSTSFTFTTPSSWQDKQADPYQAMSKEKYCFFADGYLWFPRDNPRKVNVFGFFKEDVRLSPHDHCDDCGTDECLRYLDTKFLVPDYILAELFAKTQQAILGMTMRIPEDTTINKNPNQK